MRRRTVQREKRICSENVLPGGDANEVPHHNFDPYRPANWRYLLQSAGLGRRRGKTAEAEQALALADEQNISRWELEARLLTGQDDETIATACQVSPGIVAAYHHWCFDVRDRLQQTSAIVHAILAPAEETEPLTAGYLKRKAYFRGSMILDALLRWWHHPPHVPAPDTILDPQTWEDLRVRWLIQVDFLVFQQLAAAVLLLHEPLLETVVNTLDQLEPPRLETLRILLACLEDVEKSLIDRHAARSSALHRLSAPVSPGASELS